MHFDDISGKKKEKRKRRRRKRNAEKKAGQNEGKHLFYLDKLYLKCV